ncbi:T9SS type A sorting domain-containing protein [Thermaurantimonas aggregans]|uniref:T9SS type A sorting domain-containing protein n=1 Tax=Thermaurantimonas aggregans TaxID=2173829 RepID=UPI0023F3F13E|nr:T9SS type A sorting domain-containing protein [Thermaurantimonas aggregans]MCX8148055.1 T9SS type A sorting domain-containing protein [Thermaurantimonas aggregans]
MSENTPSKPQPTLYPNPAKDFIFIDLPEFEGRIKVRMIDLTGKVVLNDQIDLQAGNRIFVPLQQYPVGVYVLEVADAFGHQWHSKVTIRR